MAMSGRKLFEQTRGATLMLNPNLDAVTLYPAEIAAILDGKALGYFAKEELPEGTNVLLGPPPASISGLDVVLRRLFVQETAVRAAFLAEVRRQDEHAETFLLLTVVVAKGHERRILQLATLTHKSEAPQLDLPLSIRFLAPDAPLDDLCKDGVQIFGN